MHYYCTTALLLHTIDSRDITAHTWPVGWRVGKAVG